jgi:hypothetical protein
VQNVSFGVNYQGIGTASYTGSPANANNVVANANGYFPGTPAPCWANTAPTSYNIPAGATTYNGYSVADSTGTKQVPHFLDFSSVLYKDVNGRVHRQAIPPGRCLPGNLINVKTSAVAYNKASLTVLPVYPPAKAVGYPTGANQIYTTSQDQDSADGLTVYTPGSKEPTPANLNGGNGGQPATMGAIRVYFALNFGLRNALDNSCDGRTKPTAKSCVNGGFYASNLTTALLGDPSKGLGRAKYALIRLCYSPMSTKDRPWRKKAGDAVNNKQCMGIKQVLFGAESELANNPQPGTTGTPNVVVGTGGKLMMYEPVPAATGLAVNDVPYGAYTDGNLDANGKPTPVLSGYYITNSVGATNVSAPSPVAFCRPLSDASFPSGVNPDSRLGVYYFKNASGSFCQRNQFLDNTPVPCADNCVMSGSSWSTTKGTNVNLNDPAWYTVDILLPADMGKGNYFVRIFAMDENFSYLGFGSSAGSANLTNTAAQNLFHVDKWASWSSYAKRGESIADIRAGAAGCSAMSLVVGGLFFAREVRASRRKAALATVVLPAEAPPS